MVDDLSDLSKGQALDSFHCDKYVIACCAYCAYCLFFISISASVLVYCMFLYVCIFDTTILLNKVVYTFV